MADQGLIDPVERIARPELQVGDNLIVSTPPGVQLAADIAELLDQGRLDVHVDVFALQDERKIPTFYLSLDFRQARTICWHSLARQKSDALEHACVRGRPLDVVLEEPTIKGDGFRELLHAAVGSGGETATPGLLSHSALLPRDSRRDCVSFWH